MKIQSLLILALLGGCPEGGDAADAGPPADCDVTLTAEVREPGGTWAPVGQAAGAELVLGFQGFKYVYVRGRLDRLPADPTGAVLVTLEGEATRSQPLGELALTPDGTGGLVTEPLRVFFNDDPLPTLVDRLCELELRVGEGSCAAASGGAVELVYDASCYEGADGQRICAADAGVP